MIIIVLCYQLERLLGARVVSSPIDDCLRSDRCPDGGENDSCSNSRAVSGEPLLVNTNLTSVVGLTAIVRAECKCFTRNYVDHSRGVECRADSCLNGGTCHQEEYSFT